VAGHPADDLSAMVTRTERIDLSAIGTHGWVKDRFPLREPPKQNRLDLQKDHQAPWLSWVPPAPVDIPAYGRRAGEIIARAAMTDQSQFHSRVNRSK
jgi:hypothetical protein